MKNIKFSRLFAAMMFVAVLSFAGCKQQPEETPKTIKGNWRGGEFSDKFEITDTVYNNYYNDGQNDVLYYSTKNVEVVEIDATSGYVYGQFDDADHIGYMASVGQWYAIYYFDLKDNSVKISQADTYNNPVKACDSLEDAKRIFTVENGYMSEAAGKYSTCTRE